MTKSESSLPESSLPLSLRPLPWDGILPDEQIKAIKKKVRDEYEQGINSDSSGDETVETGNGLVANAIRNHRMGPRHKKPVPTTKSDSITKPAATGPSATNKLYGEASSFNRVDTKVNTSNLKLPPTTDEPKLPPILDEENTSVDRDVTAASPDIEQILRDLKEARESASVDSNKTVAGDERSPGSFPSSSESPEPKDLRTGLPSIDVTNAELGAYADWLVPGSQKCQQKDMIHGLCKKHFIYVMPQYGILEEYNQAPFSTRKMVDHWVNKTLTIEQKDKHIFKRDDQPALLKSVTEMFSSLYADLQLDVNMSNSVSRFNNRTFYGDKRVRFDEHQNPQVLALSREFTRAIRSIVCTDFRKQINLGMLREKEVASVKREDIFKSQFAKTLANAFAKLEAINALAKLEVLLDKADVTEKFDATERLKAAKRSSADLLKSPIFDRTGIEPREFPCDTREQASNQILGLSARFATSFHYASKARNCDNQTFVDTFKKVTSLIYSSIEKNVDSGADFDEAVSTVIDELDTGFPVSTLLISKEVDRLANKTVRSLMRTKSRKPDNQAIIVASFMVQCLTTMKYCIEHDGMRPNDALKRVLELRTPPQHFLTLDQEPQAKTAEEHKVKKEPEVHRSGRRR